MYRALLALLFALNLQLSAAEGYDDYLDDDLGYGDELSTGDNYNNDPLESFNRAIFEFNEVIDNNFMEPVARTYVDVVPAWGRQRVSNVLDNLDEPVTFANSILQGDIENALTAFWRLAFNSTFGLGGTFDVATELGLPQRKEDFGQTLGVWGFEDSTYIVLPVLGPSTLRDLTGRVVDNAFDPAYYYADDIDDWAFYTRTGLEILNGRANALQATDHISKSALDPYTAMRSFYLQNRAAKINNEE